VKSNTALVFYSNFVSISYVLCDITASLYDDVVAKTVWYAQRRNYRELRRRKSHAFWCTTVESERASPSHKLWRSVNLLLGRGKPPVSFDIIVDEFSQFFHDKVDAVKQNTAGAPEPTFLTVRPGACLVSFTPVSVDDVVSAIYRPRQTRFRSH